MNLNLPYTGLQAPADFQHSRTMTKRDILRLMARNGYAPEDLNFIAEQLKKTDKVKIAKSGKGIFINHIYFPFKPYPTGMNGVPLAALTAVVDFIARNKKLLSSFVDAINAVVDSIMYIWNGCYNATWPPEDGKKEAAKWMEEVQERIDSIINKVSNGGVRSVINDINQLSQDAAAWRISTIKEPGWHKCSQDTVDKILKPTHDKMVNLVNQFAQKLLSSDDEYTYRMEKRQGRNEFTYEYNYYVLVPKTGSGNNNQNTNTGNIGTGGTKFNPFNPFGPKGGGSGTGNGGGSGTGNGGGSGSTSGQSNQPKKSSGAGLALLALLGSMFFKK